MKHATRIWNIPNYINVVGIDVWRMSELVFILNGLVVVMKKENTSGGALPQGHAKSGILVHFFGSDGDVQAYSHIRVENFHHWTVASA